MKKAAYLKKKKSRLKKPDKKNHAPCSLFMVDFNLSDFCEFLS